MKKYFVQFKTNQAKNKAQERLIALVLDYESTLCDDYGLQRMIDSLTEKCNELKAKFPRCKPITVHHYPKGTTILDIHEFYACTPDYNDVFHSSISEVKREEFDNYSRIEKDETITMDIPAQGT